MSLAFLVPLFLLGVAGIVVPIVVHLTRRQRRNVVHFPSLMFLEKIPYQEQRRRRIQHWFLLSLRALALALVAIALPIVGAIKASEGVYYRYPVVGVEPR